MEEKRLHVFTFWEGKKYSNLVHYFVTAWLIWEHLRLVLKPDGHVIYGFTLWLHFNSINWFHRLCVRHVAKHAHGTLLKGFPQRGSPRVDSWKRNKELPYWSLLISWKSWHLTVPLPWYKTHSLHICCMIQVCKNITHCAWQSWLPVFRLPDWKWRYTRHDKKKPRLLLVSLCYRQ